MNESSGDPTSLVAPPYQHNIEVESSIQTGHLIWTSHTLYLVCWILPTLSQSSLLSIWPVVSTPLTKAVHLSFKHSSPPSMYPKADHIQDFQAIAGKRIVREKTSSGSQQGRTICQVLLWHIRPEQSEPCRSLRIDIPRRLKLPATDGLTAR